MSMVGQLQQAVTLGRYDILEHVVSMSNFRLAPIIGHLERLKSLYRYLLKTKHLLLCIEPKNPITLISQYKNMIGLEQFMGNAKEEIPKDIPNC